MKKYYRKITDQLPKGKNKVVNKAYLALHLRNFLFIFLALMAGILLQLLVVLNGKYVEARTIFAEKEKNYLYWKSIVSQYPQIPDILYNAALSSVEFGKKDEAIHFLNRALTIDPLFEKAVILREALIEDKE